MSVRGSDAGVVLVDAAEAEGEAVALAVPDDGLAERRSRGQECRREDGGGQGSAHGG